MGMQSEVCAQGHGGGLRAIDDLERAGRAMHNVAVRSIAAMIIGICSSTLPPLLEKACTCYWVQLTCRQHRHAVLSRASYCTTVVFRYQMLEVGKDCASELNRGPTKALSSSGVLFWFFRWVCECETKYDAVMCASPQVTCLLSSLNSNDLFACPIQEQKTSRSPPHKNKTSLTDSCLLVQYI